MALATHGEKGLWVNPVFFAWDEQYNFYFISQLDCKHMENISSNDEVCCTIFVTAQENDFFGAYLSGNAKLLTEDNAEKKIADDVYYGRIYPNDTQGKERNADGYRNDPTWHFVKIELTGLWYFDTRYFEENRVAVPDEIWRG